ncbi:AIG2-like family [Achromobacter sp. 2789STDY5608615]|uniref:gamma-glutamylcyclotransferase family protein n=1 Tax=Achromobacter sp. 2789STDY5608615 TaxID=1806492 RepID=UPI0006C3648E|nr:gamma-glutamylcyclotransferase family protein [Achromobacter sp. 2789STDY5608615]CUK17236.1 AIG2-like family [Achromobacter sp. 2789STDY5608615]
MSIYVFVYGTLRAGEINDLAQAAARRGLPPARHVGPATVPGMLVDFGDWPGLLPVADDRRVLGDIYEVDPALVALMDEIEEYAPPTAPAASCAGRCWPGRWRPMPLRWPASITPSTRRGAGPRRTSTAMTG